jgi:hypothetical protein
MRTRTTVAALSPALLLCSSLVFASPAKTYQVTGPLLEVRSDMIAVQKGNDRWEIARDPSTVVRGGDLKVGQKVTVEYRMSATSIEVKPAAAAAKKKK